MPNAREVLQERYSRFETALARVRANGWDEGVFEPLSVLTGMVAQVLRPAVERELDGGVTLVEASRARHSEILNRLLAARDLDADCDAFRAEIDRVHELVEADRRQSFDEFLPRLEEHEVDLDELGELMLLFER